MAKSDDQVSAHDCADATLLFAGASIRQATSESLPTLRNVTVFSLVP